MLTGLSPSVALLLWADGDEFVREFRESWQATDTTLVLRRDLGAGGRVVDAAGWPLPHARLTLRRQSEDVFPWAVDTGVDADGRFHIAQLGAGDKATLSLMDGKRIVAQTVVTAGDQNVRLVWDDPEHFALAFSPAIHFAPDGIPDVTLSKDGVILATVPSGRRRLETFAVADLPVRLDIQIGPLRDGSWAVLRDVEPRGILRVGEDAMQSGRRLNGRVTTDSDDRPAAAIVTVTDGDGFAVSVRTNQGGDYEVPGVPMTALTVLVASADGGAGSERAIAPGLESTTCDITLRD